VRRFSTQITLCRCRQSLLVTFYFIEETSEHGNRLLCNRATSILRMEPTTMGCFLFVLQSCWILSMTVLGTGKKQTYRVSLPTSFFSRSDCCFRCTSACCINEIMRGTVQLLLCLALNMKLCISISPCVRASWVCRPRRNSTTRVGVTRF
jgi:hypothetical protein